MLEGQLRALLDAWPELTDAEVTLDTADVARFVKLLGVHVQDGKVYLRG